MLIPIVNYMHTLVEQLVKKGLERDVSIRAAPYDFRLGLGEYCCLSAMNREN